MLGTGQELCGARAALEGARRTGRAEDREGDSCQHGLCLTRGVQGWLWWPLGAGAFYKGPSALRKATESRGGGRVQKPCSAATLALAASSAVLDAPDKPRGAPEPLCCRGTLCQPGSPWPKRLGLTSRGQ